jgi:uncharacterized membrane protein YsdA (DUF1294 family)
MVQLAAVTLADSFAVLWFAGFNLAAFLLFGLDKGRAARGGRRVPESRLALLGALGGWPGGWLGMRVFRHKTLKGSFQFLYFLALVPFVAGVLCWWHWR